MLTPIDIQNKTLKTGMGYNKKDVDDFLIQIIRSYEELYKENVELKDKISTLSEGIQYYKTIETTLQKALVLAEKTSKETKEAAIMKAEALEKDARVKANLIIADAKHDLETIRKQTINLVQNYDNFRIQFKKLAETQLEMIEGESFKIYAPDLENMMASVSSLETDEDLSSYLSDDNGAKDSPVSAEPAEEEMKKTEEELSKSISDLENPHTPEPENGFSDSAFMEQPAYESGSPDSGHAPESFTTEETLVINRQPSYSFTESQPLNTDSIGLQPENNTGFTSSMSNTLSSMDNLSDSQPEMIPPMAGQPEMVSPMASQPESISPMASQPEMVSPMTGQPESISPINPSSGSDTASRGLQSETTREHKSTYIDELRFDANSFSNPEPAPAGNAKMPNPYISPSTQKEEREFDKDISSLQADLGQRISQPDNSGDDDMFEFISTED